MMQTYSMTMLEPWVCYGCGLPIPAMVEHGKDQGCDNPGVNGGLVILGPVSVAVAPDASNLERVARLERCLLLLSGLVCCESLGTVAPKERAAFLANLSSGLADIAARL